MAYVSETNFRVIKVTEWRNNMVWKTKVVGTVWVANDPEKTAADLNAIAREHGGDMLGSMPTDTPYDNWFRSRKVS